MNISVQAHIYANEPATRCNSFIAAFILFYFTCAAGLNSKADVTLTGFWYRLYQKPVSVTSALREVLQHGDPDATHPIN